MLNCKHFTSLKTHTDDGEVEVALIEKNSSKIIQYNGGVIFIYGELVVLKNLATGKWWCSNIYKTETYDIIPIRNENICTVDYEFKIKKEKSKINEFFFNGIKCSKSKNCSMILEEIDGYIVKGGYSDFNKDYFVYVTDSMAHSYMIINDFPLVIYITHDELREIRFTDLCKNYEDVSFDIGKKKCSLLDKKDCNDIKVQLSKTNVTFNANGNFTYKCVTTKYERYLRVYVEPTVNEINNLNEKIYHLYTFHKIHVILNEIYENIFINENKCENFPCENSDVIIRKNNEGKFIIQSESTFIKIKATKGNNEYYFNIENFINFNVLVENYLCFNKKSPTRMEIDNIVYSVCDHIYAKVLLDFPELEKDFIKISASPIENTIMTCSKNFKIGSRIMCKNFVYTDNCLNYQSDMLTKSFNEYRIKPKFFQFINGITCDDQFYKITTEIKTYHKKVQLNYMLLCNTQNNVRNNNPEVYSLNDQFYSCSLNKKNNCIKINALINKDELIFFDLSIVSMKCQMKNVKYFPAMIYVGMNYNDNSGIFSIMNTFDCTKLKDKCNQIIPKNVKSLHLKCPNSREYQIVYEIKKGITKFYKSIDIVQNSEESKNLILENIPVNNTLKFICINEDSFVYNEIISARIVLQHIRLYNNLAKITIDCSALSQDFQVESSFSKDCDKTKIDSCFSNQFNVEKNEKIFIIKTNVTKIETDLFFKCFDSKLVIGFELLADKPNSQITFDETTLKFEHFCKEDYFSFKKNDVTCNKLSSKGGICKQLGSFFYQSVRFFTVAPTSIICQYEYLKIEQDLVYEKCLKGIKCDNNCFDLSKKCNGIDDCLEKTDESECQNVKSIYPESATSYSIICDSYGDAINTIEFISNGTLVEKFESITNKHYKDFLFKIERRKLIMSFPSLEIVKNINKIICYNKYSHVINLLIKDVEIFETTFDKTNELEIYLESNDKLLFNEVDLCKRDANSKTCENRDYNVVESVKESDKKFIVYKFSKFFTRYKYGDENFNVIEIKKKTIYLKMIFKEVKRNLTRDSVFHLKEFCPDEYFYLIKDNLKCNKKNVETCKEIIEWSKDNPEIIKFLVEGTYKAGCESSNYKILTKDFKMCKSIDILCTKLNKCVSKKTIHDISSCLDENILSKHVYKFSNQKDGEVQLSCKNIDGKIEFMEGLHKHNPLPEYISENNKVYTVDVKNLQSITTFTCFGATKRRFVMNLQEIQDYNLLEVNINSFCTQNNVKIIDTTNNNSCQLNEYDCDNMLLSYNSKQWSELTFKYTGVYRIECTETYYQSRNSISLNCSDDNHHKCSEKSKKCIHKSLVCNGFKDCDNDETKECQNYVKQSATIPNVFQINCPEEVLDYNSIKLYEINKQLNSIQLIDLSNLKTINSFDEINELRYFVFNGQLFFTNKLPSTSDLYTCKYNQLNKVNSFFENNLFYKINMKQLSQLNFKCSNYKNIIRNSISICKEDECENKVNDQTKFKYIIKNNTQNDRFECWEENFAHIYEISIGSFEQIDELTVNIKRICERNSIFVIMIGQIECSKDNSKEFCTSIMKINEHNITMYKEQSFNIVCKSNQYDYNYPIDFKCPAGYYTCTTNKKCIKEELVKNLVDQCGDDSPEVLEIDTKIVYLSNENDVLIDCSSIEDDLQFRIGKKVICQNDDQCENMIRDGKNITLVNLQFNSLINNHFYCQSLTNPRTIKQFILKEVKENPEDNIYHLTKYCPSDFIEQIIQISNNENDKCKINDANDNKCEILNIVVNKAALTATISNTSIYKIVCQTKFFISSYNLAFGCNRQLFLCQKTNQCTKREEKCDGINKCDNDEIDCENILYISATMEKIFELPILQDGQLKRIDSDVFVEIDVFDKKVEKKLIYTKVGNQITIENIGENNVNNHLLSNTEQKFILQFVKKNTIKEVFIAIGQTIIIQCDKTIMTNFRKVFENTNLEEKMTVDFHIIRNGNSYKIKFKSSMISSIDCNDRHLSNTKYKFVYDEAYKMKLVERSKFIYKGFCESIHEIELNDEICEIENNEKNSQKSKDYFSIEDESKIIVFNIADSFTIKCRVNEIVKMETISSDCEIDYFKCPVNKKCFKSKEVYNEKLQCDESINIFEELYEIKTLPNETIKLFCSDLAPPYYILLGKYKICSSDNCKILKGYEGTYEFVPEFVITTKYSCKNEEKTKSFMLYKNEQVTKYNNQIAINSICTESINHFNILKKNELLCTNEPNKDFNKKCKDNGINLFESTIIFKQTTTSLILECVNDHFSYKTNIEIECSHPDYYHCKNKMCLKKENIFSLREQCNEEDLSIKNIHVSTNGEDVQILCGGVYDINEYVLYLGIKEICSKNSQCFDGIKRKNEFSFIIPSNILAISNVKLYCSLNNYDQSDKSFTFKNVQNNRTEEMLIRIDNLLPNGNQIMAINLYSKKTNKKCSNEPDFIINCETVGINLKIEKSIEFINTDNYTLEIFTNDFVTRLNYEFIDKNNHKNKNTYSDSSRNGNITGIIIGVLLLVIILVVILLIFIRKRKSRKHTYAVQYISNEIKNKTSSGKKKESSGKGFYKYSNIDCRLEKNNLELFNECNNMSIEDNVIIVNNESNYNNQMNERHSLVRAISKESNESITTPVMNLSLQESSYDAPTIQNECSTENILSSKTING
uniref:Low density lipoprotein receptor class A-like protein 3 n=1 Tax=Tetracapsuloides bryosalmonae TaxID=271932 RepID=A0A7L8Y7Z7_9CNID|nr:low density lipoprotein receptor class A-like protein 3 [Tetracapsuloides bryosalmonae]